MRPAESPFTKTDLRPMADEYTERTQRFGLKLPTGEILLNFNSNTTYGMLRDLAKALKAEVVVVHGTTTFTPDKAADND